VWTDSLYSVVDVRLLLTSLYPSLPPAVRNELRSMREECKVQEQMEKKTQNLDEPWWASSLSVKRSELVLKMIAFCAVVLAVCSLSAFAKDKSREVVTLVENESTTTPYDREVDGHVSVSCYGSTCSGYYRPPTSGTQQIQGAILKLQRSDSSVVIAQCVAKVDVLSSVIVGMAAAADNDPNSPTVFRNCRIPVANLTVEAEFDLHHNQVKLFMLKPSANGSGKIISETYYVRGILHPASSVVPVELLV